MRKHLVLLPVLLCFLILFGPSWAGAQAMRMDLNAVYPASNFHTQGAVNFADKVRQATDGSVDITVHPGGSLGFKGPELLKAIMDGTLPMSDILMGVVSGSEEIFGLSTYPMIVGSFTEAKVFYDAARPHYESACAKWNQKLLYAAPWPPSGLFTTKALVVLDDMNGLKTRTYDRNGALFLEKAGGNPMSLPWGEVYSALSTGLIDSVLTSAVSGKDGTFWEVLDHFTKINFAYPLNMVTINLDYWNALNAEQQQAMLRAAREVETEQWAASETSNEESLKVLATNGIEIAGMTPQIEQALQGFAMEILDEFKAQAGDDSRAALEAIGK
jgi:TRAP-type transport system periplasmic protein